MSLSEPIRVAHVIGKMMGGGVEAIVMNYYRFINHDVVQFDFLVDADSTLVPREEIEDLGGRVIEVPPYQNLLAYRRSIGNEFRRNNWNIVHSHINALSVFPLQVAKEVGVPIRIAHSHSAFGKGEHLRNAAKLFLKQFANLYPTNRFACSKAAGDWLFGINESYELIYNAVELEKFAFKPEARARVRASLGISDGQFVIGHVGRLASVKNHAFLIDAFANLCKTRPDCLLLFVGDGELRPALEQLAVKNGVADKVRFLGQRLDANDLYQAFDVFALPSLYEGFSVAAIEAQKAGLPCLLSDRVSREMDITKRCQFLPIYESRDWALKLNTLERRSDMERGASIEQSFMNFDISKQAPLLAARYVEMEAGIHK